MRKDEPANAAVNLDRAKGAPNVLHLRMVELFAFFVIVFAARELANFAYRSHLLLILFLTAAVLQFGGQLLMGGLTRHREPARRREVDPRLLWYSSLIDLLLVLGIVYLTGTIESPFLFLLVVPLFFTSHIFPRCATVVSFLVGSVVIVAVMGYLELRGIVPHYSCYPFDNGIHYNTHYYVGSLLVLSGFLSLMLFLARSFRDHFQDSMAALQKKDEARATKLSELVRLYDISLGINAVMTVETLLKMVAKEATLLLDLPWASIVLFNAHRELTHSAFVGIPEEYQSRLGSKIRKGGVTEWLWKNNKPIVIEDVLSDERARTGEFLLATNIRSLIGLPLSNGQHVIGVVFVGDFAEQRFEDNDTRLLSIMSDQLAIAIAKSKLYESLQAKIKSYDSRVQKLEKVNHLKSEYVSHVSHELRTPLTSIKAYLETLEKHIDDPTFTEKKDFLGIVSKEADRLIRIVNDILDVSNIEFGHRPLQRTVFDLGNLVTEVISVLQPKLQEKGIKVEQLIPGNVPKVNADKDLITQVFVNLINNAIKYSPAGTTIRVRLTERPVDFMVSIEDEGIGIPEAQVKRIFEKYFRVRSDQSKHYDGVGLGLAIVKNIIEQHGGAISVSSEEDVGSRFMFSLAKEHCVNDLFGYISKGISAKTELQELLNVVVRMIAELLSAKIVSIMLLDNARSELFVKVSFGLEEWIVDKARVKMGEGIAGKVAETGMPLLIDNIEKNDVYRSPNNPQYETMSLLSVPLRVGDVIVGVINVNNKASGEPFDQDDMNLLLSFAERISTALDRLRSVEDTKAYLQETVEAFGKLLKRQSKTGTIERTIALAVKTGRKLGLSEKDVKVIQYVASVHDIGMTKVGDEILDKTFGLTVDEVKEIKQHPREGTELIRPLEFVERVSNIILHHHERVDGLGYPMGLRGDDIPVGARILAVVDAYQSMTSDKPYRSKMAPDAAVRELVEWAGKQFDVEVVECFVDVLRDEGKISTAAVKNTKRALKQVVQSSSY